MDRQQMISTFHRSEPDERPFGKLTVDKSVETLDTYIATGFSVVKREPLPNKIDQAGLLRTDQKVLTIVNNSFSCKRGSCK
jgi:hypothetical protein